jgi:hypothetical protein
MEEQRGAMVKTMTTEKKPTLDDAVRAMYPALRLVALADPRNKAVMENGGTLPESFDECDDADKAMLRAVTRDALTAQGLADRFDCEVTP